MYPCIIRKDKANRKRTFPKKEAKPGQIIRIEQEQLSKHLDKIVRGTVEETLNQLLDAEADRLCMLGNKCQRKEGVVLGLGAPKGVKAELFGCLRRVGDLGKRKGRKAGVEFQNRCSWSSSNGCESVD